GLVALVVSRDRTAGIDVERTRRGRGELRELAGRFFAPSEAAVVRATPEASLEERFFFYWTLKESYIKALGKGLAIPLDGFAFAAAGSRISLRILPTHQDDPARWRFQHRQATPEHHLALAVRAAPEEEILVTTRRMLPLGEEELLEVSAL